MSAVPRAKPYSPAAIAALEAKALPAPGVLAAMPAGEQRVVTAYATLSKHHRSTTPRPKKTLGP